MICKEDLYRLFEDKSRFVKRLPITDEEKTSINDFFKSHSTLENKIDWNERDLDKLTSSIRELITSTNKAAEERETQKRGYRGNIDWNAHNLIYLGELNNFHYAVVTTYKGAVFCDSAECGGAPAKWCIGYEKTNKYWRKYIKNGRIFVLKINFNNLSSKTKLKYMLEIRKKQKEVQGADSLFINTWNQEDEEVQDLNPENLKEKKEKEFILTKLQELGQTFDTISAQCRKLAGVGVIASIEQIRNIIQTNTLADIISTYIEPYYPGVVEAIPSETYSYAIRVNDPRMLSFTKFTGTEEAELSKKLVRFLFKKGIEYVEFGEKAKSYKRYKKTLFNDWEGLKKVDLKNLTLQSDISGMFSYCTELREVVNIDFSPVKIARDVFYSTQYLKYVDCSTCGNIHDTYRMFIYSGVSNLGDYDFRNVREASLMFYGTKLEEFDFSRILNPNFQLGVEMFSGCSKLKTVKNLRRTKNFTNLTSIFESCNNLETIDDFSFLENAKVYSALDQCYNLNYLDISYLNKNPYFIELKEQIKGITNPDKISEMIGDSIVAIVTVNQYYPSILKNTSTFTPTDSPEFNNYIKEITKALPLNFKKG